MSQEVQAHVLARYKIIKKIGSGAYGHVYKVTDRASKKTKALKKNFDAFNNSTDAQRTYRQIMFLMQLKHPNIITLDEVIHAQNGKDIYLVFEHMDADLHMLIRENILEEKHKKYILYQTAKAVMYVHSAGLIHRDLKPSNILVNESCEAKLCDFGLVRSIDDHKPFNQFDALTEYIATRWYRAPEILLGARTYSKGIDTWSFGCLLAEMIKGRPLFPGTSTMNQLERVLMWTGPPTTSDIQSMSISTGKQIVEILSKTKKANRRQFFNQIDAQCLDLISKCLQFNPQKRISIEQILTHPYLAQFYEQSEIVTSHKKIRVPIDDNKRLSLRDYRGLIYQEIKKRSKKDGNLNIPLNQLLPHESYLYRIRQKQRKTMRTQQSDQPIKQTLRPEPHKKASLSYQNQSRIMSIKKTDPLKKKSFLKAESVHYKNLKTMDPDEQRPIDKIMDRIKAKQKLKIKQQVQATKLPVFKQNTRATKTNWNKVKRSVTEQDRKDKKMLATFIELTTCYKK